MTFLPNRKTKILLIIAASFFAVIFILYAVAKVNRSPSNFILRGAPAHVPGAVAAPTTAINFVETTTLPLAITSVFLPAQAKVAVGGGAIAVIDQQVLVLDRLGHLFSYKGGTVTNSSFPDLPMHAAEYIDRSGITTNSVELRARDLVFHDGFLFASYDTYDSKKNTTHVEISKIRVRQDSAVPDGGWTVIFRGDDIPVSYYQPGGSAGGVMAFTNDTLYFAIGDYNFNYAGAPGRRRSQDAEMPAAQDRTAALGKIFGYNLKNGTLRKISFGHRVEEGLLVTTTGELLETENAERGGDKLNRIFQDGNYGWPYEILGTNYGTYNSDDRTGSRKILHWLAQFVEMTFGVPSWIAVETRSLDQGSVVGPVYAWLPSIAPSAIVEVKDFNPVWNGDLLVGSLKAQSLFRLRYRGGRVVYSERIWIGHRIRDIVNLHGQLVLWTDDGSLMFLSVADNLLAANHIDNESAYTDHRLLRCITCHSFAADNRNYWSPSLRGVFGRPIASDAFSGYSAALKTKGGIWTEDALAAFLSSPEDFAPGTTMPNLGLSAQDILQEIAALKAEKSQDILAPTNH